MYWCRNQSNRNYKENRFSNEENNEVIVTEPRRDASYNSLLDRQELLSDENFWTVWKNSVCQCDAQTYKVQHVDRRYDPKYRDANQIPPTQRRSYRSKSKNSRISPIDQNEETKSNDMDSSFENERKMYESIPNSRANSYNRVRSPGWAPLRNKVRYESIPNQFDSVKSNQSK